MSKIVSVLGLAFLSNVALASECAILTGKYQLVQHGELKVTTMTQSGCESLTWTETSHGREQAPMTLITDGKVRNFGTDEMTYQASLDLNGLILIVTNYKSGKMTDYTLAKFVLAEKGNLQMSAVTTDSNGKKLSEFSGTAEKVE